MLSFLLSALDDTEITHQQCKPTDTCDFEEGWCNFQNTTGYYNWKLGNNGTATVGTGPDIDHVMIIHIIIT